MIIVTAMAVLGIGGGLAILARAYYREHRRLRYARWLCAHGHVCMYHILGLPGVTRGPNWRAERRHRDAVAWNADLLRRRAQLTAQAVILRATIDAALRAVPVSPTTLVPPDRRIN